MKKLIFTLLLSLPIILFSQSPVAGNRTLFDKKSVGEIRIILPTSQWGDALDSMRLYGDGMLRGTVIIDGALYKDAGVRYRGNNSYQMGIKRNPFQIKLNLTDKEANHQGFTSIKLSSALRDPSMAREALFYEIAGKYMPSPQTSYTKVFVNEDYVGVYVNVESVDKQFLQKHYDSSENSFFKAGVDYKVESPKGCRQNIYGSLEYEDNIECYKRNYEIESETGWIDLKDLTQTLSKDPKNIDKILDVDNTLWMLALNNVLVNLNSYSGNYSQNYYLYKDDNGRFQPIHWDLNLAFGSYKNIGTGSDLELKDLQRLSPLLHADNELKPLINQLLKDPYYKKVYLSHIRQILEENIDNGWYEKRVQELQGLIVIPFSEDKNKYYTLDEFQNSLKETVGKRSKIPGIVELMSKRSRFLKNHPELTALPSAITEVKIAGRGKFDNTKLNAFKVSAKADRFPKKLTVHYRFNTKSPYKTILMEEEGGTDMPSGVKQYVVAIESKSETEDLEYYITAENAGTVSFSPANYATKPLMAKASDLNK
jgi:CotH kinase protein